MDTDWIKILIPILAALLGGFVGGKRPKTDLVI